MPREWTGRCADGSFLEQETSSGWDCARQGPPQEGLASSKNIPRLGGPSPAQQLGTRPPLCPHPSYTCMASCHLSGSPSEKQSSACALPLTCLPFWLRVACSSIWYKLPLSSHSTCYSLYTQTPNFSFETVSLNCCSPAHRDPLIATTVSVTLSYATARLWPFVTKPLETTQVVANGASSGPGVSCSAVLTLLCVVPASGTTAACWTPRLPAQESWPLPLCTAHALRLTQ